MNAESFAEQVRRLRRAAGLTQEELAERAGLSARGIGDLERGARAVPQRETLRRGAEALTPAPPGAPARPPRGPARSDPAARPRRAPRPAPGGPQPGPPVPPPPLVGREPDLA